MGKRITILLLVFFSVQAGLSAQQDPMFTKYMFNTLTYNPGYTGSKDYLSMGLLHRTQWWGIKGAPHSQSFWIHSPIKYERIALGGNIVNDIIGPTRMFSVNVNYAYRIPFKNGSKLSVGLQGGIRNWRADWSKLTFESVNDEAYDMDEMPNLWLPNFGVGLYYYHRNYFFGVGVPNILEQDLRESSEVTTDMWARTFRHYYFSAGAAIPLGSPDFVLKPMALVKTVGLFSGLRNQDDPFVDIGAPTEFDIDLSLLIYETLWIGTSFRSSVERFIGNTSSFDSADVWASYNFRNGLRLGLAYDFTLTKLRQPAQGSFEVMAGYDFDFKDKKIVTPRYF